MKIFKEFLPYIIIIIVVVSIRMFIITPVRVNGDSMNPTLKSNQIMLLNKVTKPKRFNIVVIDLPSERLIKRVIGLPGETIEVVDNVILINGEEIADLYGDGMTYDFGSITLESDEYFVMGDNRENSKDSRFYGPFKKKNIEGKTNIIIYPFNSFGFVK